MKLRPIPPASMAAATLPRAGAAGVAAVSGPGAAGGVPVLAPSRQVFVRLARGHAWRVESDPGEVALRCVDGVAWVTQAGDADDHLITAGRLFVPDERGGEVVVQAIEDVVVEVLRR